MSDTMKQLPAVGKLLNLPAMSELVARYGRDVVTYALRRAVAEAREQLETSRPPPTADSIAARAAALVHAIATPSLKPVINASGVVLHTNLGRAVLGPQVLADLAPIVCGYSNLEFDLGQGRRGHRADHVAELLRFVTGAEDIVVVNNNAAALVLVLMTFAKRREVIISRGELIEIGGSFRLPEIMKTGGATMVEVGATNRTRAADYERAINEHTALLFKAHKSNYQIAGFTEEVSIRDLADLAHAHRLPLVYDIGSGLLRKPAGISLPTEPDVQSALADGADLVTFSCDKLLGGPQAGVIAGRAELIRKLAKAPLMRALRVGKLTLAALGSAARNYLSKDALVANNPTFAMLERTPAEIERLAQALARAFTARGLTVEIVDSQGQSGGGTLPDVELPGKALALVPPAGRRGSFVNEVFHRLLQLERPILGVLREGRLLFDVRAIFADDIPYVAKAVAEVIQP